MRARVEFDDSIIAAAAGAVTVATFVESVRYAMLMGTLGVLCVVASALVKP
jgi:hypothetical protein